MEKGCIQLYYGDGKGKTTAAMGQVIRCAGHGFRVLVYQFLKEAVSGEVNIIRNLPGVTYIANEGPIPFLFHLTPEQQDIVCEVSAECDKRISTAQAEQIRRLDEITEESVKAILLPEKPWNAANEFVSRSRGLIPKTATEADIEAVARLIEHYFEKGA